MYVISITSISWQQEPQLIRYDGGVNKAELTASILLLMDLNILFINLFIYMAGGIELYFLIFSLINRSLIWYLNILCVTCKVKVVTRLKEKQVKRLK